MSNLAHLTVAQVRAWITEKRSKSLSDVINDITEAHNLSSHNRDMQGPCGCFYCGATFDAGDIVEWVDGGETALCPKCHIDSVIPGDRVRIDDTFLAAMYEHWFTIEGEL